jgi:hypothetical protein
MIYIHLLTWVGFGLLGYLPNTLYKKYADRFILNYIQGKLNMCQEVNSSLPLVQSYSSVKSIAILGSLFMTSITSGDILLFYPKSDTPVRL